MRRTRVQAVLTPPTVNILLLPQEGCSKTGGNRHPFDNSQEVKPCSLCHVQDQVCGSRGQEGYVVEAVRAMMKEVGLDLNQDLGFCSFCGIQLQNLTRLKMELDRLGGKFVTMVLGLQTLFSTGISQGASADGGHMEEEDNFDVKPDLSKAQFFKSECAVKTDDEGGHDDTNFESTMNLDIPIDNCTREGREEAVTATGKQDLQHSQDDRGYIKEEKDDDFEVKPEVSVGVPDESHANNSHPDGEMAVAQPTEGGLYLDNLKTEPSHQGYAVMGEKLEVGGKKKRAPGGGYKCYFCGKILSTKYSLVEHMRLHTLERRFFGPKDSSSKKSLKKNKMGHRFLCAYCGRGFDKKSNFDAHIQVHTGDKPHVCHICFRPFGRKTDLNRHLRTHLPQEERPTFPCSLCPNTYTDNYELRRHIKKIHPKGGTIIDPAYRLPTFRKPAICCPVCNKTFPKPSKLRNHERVHTGEKPYVCHICFRPFGSNTDLNRHLTIHLPNDERPVFPCHLCPNTYARKYRLGLHMKKIHNQETMKGSAISACPKPRINCDICNKSFSCPFKLRSHKRVHKGEKYACPVCSHCFADRWHLKRHISTMSCCRPSGGERTGKFLCYFCQKVFLFPRALGQHMRTHTLEVLL